VVGEERGERECDRSVDLTLVGDYDEPRRRVRLRRSATKTRTALRVDLPDVLADAVEAALPHRSFRGTRRAALRRQRC
jgi:hypothetical protein